MNKLIMILAMISLGLSGCTTDIPTIISSGDVFKPIMNVSGENTLVSGEDINVSGEKMDNKVLLEDDFQILKYMTDEKNYMISPFSLKMAMMLAGNGAEGETQKEILDVFGVEDIDKYNEYAKGLIEKYNSNKEVQLNVANSIWLNKDEAGKDIEFSDAYKGIVEKYYFGKAEEENADEIAKEINEWIEKKTNNKIKDMLDEKERADFLAVLVNTIYFKGEWLNQFNEKGTYKEAFTDRNSVESEIDFMHMTDRCGFYEDENMKMVRIPYKDNNTAMYFVLPTDENKMDISNALDKMEAYKVKLSIPKFKLEYNLSFKETLKTLGIKKAFEEWEAEFKNKMFTGVSSNHNVYVDDVLQKTFIEVDENGTEASAATAVIMAKATSARPEPEIIKEFKADKPFIYFIMDEDTKEILFMGEYAFAK